VPLIECLIDNERYYMPDTLPAPGGEELRASYRARLTPDTQNFAACLTLERYPTLSHKTLEELGSWRCPLGVKAV
jgi:hypothetical protein